MFKLTILRQDNTIYWVEHFNTQVELDVWLTEEQTRPYWDITFITQIDDLTPIIDPVQLLAQKESDEARAYLLATDWYVLRSFDGIPVPSEITLERIAARLKVVR
jgi:hypothetical protein